ncbi:hypothetical protein ACFPES_26430 [Paenibacillus sp. GCM10023248]|uniref:hypothetical protein n=1 Tax=Bacillales TaxID=1385 RepID=UPI0023794C2C|nr:MULTISPECIES: hypothetical protein [Bacillales]MDD9270597.1 hypothetical protein [Paenibacillus sp. MAHUQ-63]MDR6884734.1 hypothetical protein [Bacillus sp. 3255]
MGIKFGREYKDIVTDFVRGIEMVNGFYELLDMSADDWEQLEPNEQEECLRTLADDIFYGLGSSPVMQIGVGSVRHDPGNHVLKVHDGEKLVSVIYLV